MLPVLTDIFNGAGGGDSVQLPTLTQAVMSPATLPAGVPPNVFVTAPTLTFLPPPAPTSLALPGAQPAPGTTVPAGATSDCGCGAAAQSQLATDFALPVTNPTVGITNLSWLWIVAGGLLLLWIVKRPKRKA